MNETFKFYYPSLDKNEATEFGVNLKNLLRKNISEKDNYEFFESDNVVYLSAVDSKSCRTKCVKTQSVLRLFLSDLKVCDLEKKKLENQKNVVIKAELIFKDTTHSLIEDQEIAFPGAPAEWINNLRKKIVANTTVKMRTKKISDFF